MKKQKNGFTLIELIAVLVILAVIALIVTPLVMNIVKKAKHSANERSVDAYGKATELAVATYLLDTKEYPDTLEGLKVEYTGSEVICEIQKLNEDGSIYLSKCNVGGVEVKDSSTDDGYYHYGKTTDTPSEPTVYQAYNVGDVVTYNGMNFYIIEASDEASDKVTMLKSEPLTYEEIQKYSTEITPSDQNGYGIMKYGTTSEYETSYVKVAIDAWATDKINVSDLTEDSQGYKTRLLSYEDLTNNLGYVREEGASYMNLNTENTPSWVYNSQYPYWTMSQYEDFAFNVWGVDSYGSVYRGGVDGSSNVVRPVITLLKSSI